MNTTITFLQIALALVFFSSGIIILLFKEKLKSKLSWLTEYSPGMVLVICVSKLVGALGLIVPMFLSNVNYLATLSAIGIAAIMVLAFRYHLKKREYKDMPATLVFFILALIVSIYK